MKKGGTRPRLMTLACMLSLIVSSSPTQWICAQENCDYVFRDCNRNGVANELDDIVTMIAYYRGTAIPAYTCDCPPHDSLFMPDADTDGNCVPLEMSDVVAIIAPPGDWPPYDGCPDCPGSNLRHGDVHDGDTTSASGQSNTK